MYAFCISSHNIFHSCFGHLFNLHNSLVFVLSDCRIVAIYEMAYKLVTAQLFIKVLTQNKNRVYEICPCRESSRKNKCCGLFRKNFDYEEPISLSIVSFVRKSYVMKRNYYPIITSFINFFNSKFS